MNVITDTSANAETDMTCHELSRQLLGRLTHIDGSVAGANEKIGYLSHELLRQRGTLQNLVADIAGLTQSVSVLKADTEEILSRLDELKPRG